MRIVSVNIAQPRPVLINGREVMTGIYKKPAPGRVRVRQHSLEGDGQADLKVHGGPYKAVYAYPFEHYAYWRESLGRELSPGIFGENLTTTGLIEEQVCIGDVLRIGCATLQVTHPRLPCFKLAHKLGRPQIIKEFLASGHSGFYLRVVEEGDLGAGDEVQMVRRDPNGVSIRGLLGITDLNEVNPDLARRAMNVDALPPNWRDDVAAVAKTTA